MVNITKAEMIDLYTKDLLYNIVNTGDEIVAKTIETQGYARGTLVRCNL